MRLPEAPAPSRALAGLRVMVTRPAAQAGELARRVEAAGGRAVRFPVIEIAGVEEPEALSPVLQRLDSFHLAVFVSVNAVEHGLALARQHRPWPASLAVAAVGAATARALERAGLHVGVQPAGRFDSESLLAHPALSATAVDGQDLVIFRGRGGRALLGDTLVRRGARVCYAEVYRRVRPAGAGVPPLDRVDAAVVTSVEGLENLCAMVPRGRLEALLATPLVVVSGRLASAAAERGWQAPVVVAARAGDDAVVAALAAWRRTLPDAGPGR